jgi:hypothetical protein
MTKLLPDKQREAQGFSPELEVVHKIAHHPFSTDTQKREAVLAWLQNAKPGYQPCLFGRIAAATDRLHICLITEADLYGPDEDVRKKIQTERLAWKRRSVAPDETLTSPAHGFLLWVVSPKVAYAASDGNLKHLVSLVRELWGCPVQEDEEGNDVSKEHLYLKKPGDGSLWNFEINTDYFAAQGDLTWWHDHRFPGGVAFTANSAGHMARYREWYEGKTDQSRWLLETAMRTIDEAADTPFGRATRLLPLVGGAFLGGECPFPGLGDKERLKGKDWTRYAGYFHTDHSIREEFFQPGPAKPDSVKEAEWLQDFTYLYDKSESDHARLVAGEALSAAEVEAVLGPRRDWRRIPRPSRGPGGVLVRAAGAIRERIGLDQELVASMEKVREWRLTSEERAELV